MSSSLFSYSDSGYSPMFCANTQVCACSECIAHFWRCLLSASCRSDMSPVETMLHGQGGKLEQVAKCLLVKNLGIHCTSWRHSQVDNMYHCILFTWEWSSGGYIKIFPSLNFPAFLWRCQWFCCGFELNCLSIHNDYSLLF